MSIRKYDDKPLNEATQNQHIYITSDEEIKEEDWIFDLDIKRIVKADNLKVATSKKSQCWYYKKIILTTDQDLIKDGVQAIDDNFLEWFVKNPSCDFAHLGFKSIIGDSETKTTYKIIIPKEEHNKFLSCCKSLKECHCGKNKETLEETIDKASLLEFPIKEWYRSDDYNREEITAARDGFKRGAKWQQERMYSEEEVLELLIKFDYYPTMYKGNSIEEINKWFEQFKKK